MKIFEEIEKTREYLDYLEEHCLNIKRAYDILILKCQSHEFFLSAYNRHCLERDVLDHDLSKMSMHELVPYREAFYPVAGMEKKSLHKAWEHHKEHNSHHWESWTKMAIEDTPTWWQRQCIHMVIDWMAMGFKFGDTAESYYRKNQSVISIPLFAEDFLEGIFKKLRG